MLPAATKSKSGKIIKSYILNKFHQNPSSGSEEEFENVKSLQTDV